MTANRWLILAVLFFARTTMGFQFQSVGSVTPLLVDPLNFDFATVGTLIGLYLFPGVFVALPGGVLGATFGSKRVVVAGLILMVAGGLIMAASNALTALALGRAVAGAGAVLMNVLLTKMVSDWFGARNLATAMAVLVASWPFGIALGLVGFIPIASMFGIDGVWIAGSAASAVAAMAIVLFYREPTSSAAVAAPARLQFNLNRNEWWLVSAAGVVWATYNVAYIICVTHFPALFADRGFGVTQSNALASWLGWALILFVPVGGLLADWTGRRVLVIVAPLLIVATAIVMMVAPAMPVVAVFTVLAAIVGIPAGPIMALPAQATRAESRAVGMGIYFTLYYVLMALVPAVAGYTRDVAQSPVAPMLVAVAMLLVAVASVAVFQFLIRNRNLETTG
ncbi:MAG: CynX/NimT family MFS transporter [Pseudolabrys sp.]